MVRSVVMCFVLAILSLVSDAHSQKAPVEVNVLPDRPLIERRGSVQFLNFDFLLKNNGTADLHLNRIQVSVYDKSGKLAWQRELDENGHPSGMSTVEERDIKPASAIAIFNPFFQFDPEFPLATMVYKFFFNALGYATATPLDYNPTRKLRYRPLATLEKPT